MAVMDTFAKRLKVLREERKLSQTELANALGISRGSLSFYENAERTADIEMLNKVSEYFGVTLDYLVGKSDNRTRERAIIGDVTGLSDKSIAFLNEAIDDFFIIKTINTCLEQEDLIVAIARYFFTTPVGGGLTVYSDGSLRATREAGEELPGIDRLTTFKAADLINQALLESIKSEVNSAKEYLQKLTTKWWIGGEQNADNPEAR